MAKSFVVDTSLLVDWYIRLANVVLDILAIYIFFMVFIVFTLLLSALGLEGMSEWLGTFTDSDYNLLGVVVMMAYYMIMEITTQRTLGKLITGTMVISENGTKPSAKSIIGRSLCRIFSIEAFSFLGAYPRGWHDSASGTYVVNAKKYKEAQNVRNSFEEIGIDIEQA